MKTNSLIPAVLAFMLSVSALSSMAATRTSFLGEAAPATAADQTIAINPDTKYVNVQGGHVVKFDADGKTFIWDFDGPDSVQSFDLNRVAPPGVLDHTVTAYVSPNPIYLGGGN
jgi:hypothetical protein